MTTWKWEENYSVNISRFDTHHKKLMDLFNNLYTDIRACQDVTQKNPLIEKALAELIDYSFYHLGAEEELMFKYQYPNYVHHKKEHQQFKLRVTQLMEEYKESSIGMAFPILHFIKEWFSLHILNTDKQYASYLNKRNVR